MTDESQNSRGNRRRQPMRGQLDQGRKLIELKNEKESPSPRNVTMLEASPHLLQLLRLLWRLSRPRTFIMLFGNFFKSLLPAYDLSIRAKLLDIVNTAVRGERTVSGRRIAWLVTLHLISLCLRDVIEKELQRNQLVLNIAMSDELKRQFWNAHLRLDTAVLENPENQTILREAMYMTQPGYLHTLTGVVFNFSNTIIDVAARITATSRTISLASSPYFLLYSVLPLARIYYRRSGWRTRGMADNVEAHQRHMDIGHIAFGIKSRREVRLLKLQQFLVEMYSEIDSDTTAQNLLDERQRRIGPRLLEILSKFSSTAVYALLASKPNGAEVSLADLHLIESTTVNLIRTGDQALGSQQMSSATLSRLISFEKALSMKPIIQSPESAKTIETTSGVDIEFRSVSFRYDASKPLVLDNVSFRIKSGDVAAIVGYNGSGKSTILALLARIYDPTAGAIYLNGQDLREYDLEQLYEHLAFTPQDFSRWPLTGFENVAVGKIDARFEQGKVKDAARVTGAFDVLDGKFSTTSELKGPANEDESHTKLWDIRLSTMTSEMRETQADSTMGSVRVALSSRGTELSGGQWQKIALSRSFLHGGRLIILDEPSANLDPQAEYDLFSQVLKTRSERTTIFITHRLGVVKAADTIIVLDKGRVVEVGSHVELMQIANGVYKHLQRIQTEGFDVNS